MCLPLSLLSTLTFSVTLSFNFFYSLSLSFSLHTHPSSLQAEFLSFVFLAASAGTLPGTCARRELMWLINTALIICKLRVWVHITWEAYVAPRVSQNKWLRNPISGVPCSVDGPISLEAPQKEQTSSRTGERERERVCTGQRWRQRMRLRDRWRELRRERNRERER